MSARGTAARGWIIVVTLIAGLLAGCGGIGDGATADTGTAPPAVASHAWDSWNWDEGSFGE